MNYPGGGEGNVLIAVGNNATTVNYWLFDNTGNLRLPGNTFAVNYANGTQVPVGVTQDITSNGAMSIMTYDGNLKYVNYATVEPSTGNIAGGNISANGAVTANTAIITTGNITTINSGLLQNGNSNITITSNGNVSIQAAGSNVELVVTSTGANVTGTLDATGNITGNFFIGNGSQLTSVTAVNANVSLVSNNQEYSPLLATNTTGNLPFKASGGISWNPSTYGLTAGKILLGTGIGAQGVTGTYAFGANTAWKVQSQNGTNTDALGQEIGRFGSEYTSGATTFWDSYTSYYQGSGASSGWMILNAAGNSVANVTGTGIAVTGTLSVTGNINAGNIYATNIVAEAPFSIQSSNFSANVGGRYGVDTSAGAVTSTLPTSPSTGGAIFFADAGGAFASNNLTINPNGQTIMGSAGNMTVSNNNQSFGLFFNGATWRTYN
jgi:hypothetical protein